MSSLSVAGFCAPLAIYLMTCLLHAYLPARLVDGYVRDQDGNAVIYRINGLLVAVIMMALWYALGAAGWLSWEWLYRERYSAALGACTLGLLYTLQLVLPAPPTGRGWWVDLFLGRVDNRQYARHIDAKMLLYLLGVILLILNALSAAAHHRLQFGALANPGVTLHLVLLLWFAFDYLVFERVHLYTYDLVTEKLGFKLAWGCLLFYPFFYPIGLWASAALPTPSAIERFGSWWLLGSAALFFVGWGLARGANMQKYRFKLAPEAAFLGIQPQTIGQGNQQLLASGFWGMARHVNYLGEILMATGLALALGHFATPWAWLYPLYYVLLLLPRERDDDKRCAAKYGTTWQAYRQRVPWRILPRIY